MAPVGEVTVTAENRDRSGIGIVNTDFQKSRWNVLDTPSTSDNMYAGKVSYSTGRYARHAGSSKYQEEVRSSEQAKIRMVVPCLLS